jgi:hypothetical protein
MFELGEDIPPWKSSSVENENGIKKLLSSPNESLPLAFIDKRAVLDLELSAAYTIIGAGTKDVPTSVLNEVRSEQLMFKESIAALTNLILSSP